MFRISIPAAILITAVAVIYQRTTGPTYPKKFNIETSQGERVRIKLPRTQENDKEASLEIPLFNPMLAGEVAYRRYPLNEPWTNIAMKKEQALLTAKLPIQPAAGKLEYYITLRDGAKLQELGSVTEPIIIRYKGPVPVWILAPHIFCMFLSMLFASIVAIEALYKTERYYPLTLFTTGCLIVGGMILGPFVQKYAFGVYWAGFPYGFDLTDNKLLIGVIVWLLAALFSWKQRRPLASVAAAVILIAVYSIPHSRMGSQFNYEKGTIQTSRKF